MASANKILAVLDSLTSPPVQEAHIESLLAATDDHRSQLKMIIQSKNIQAVGISEKISKRKKTGKLALVFYVEKKIPLEKLKGNEVIPPTIPESMSGGVAMPTDVVAIGKLKAEVNITRQPLQPGNSIGHFKVDGGTFGAVVKDKNNKLYILSNSHVLADSGRAKIGDKILYPGKFDTGKAPADVRGKLHKFIPFDKSDQFINIVDCAIAEVEAAHLPDLLAEIKGIGLPKGIIKPKRGMKVMKVGRTSGKTSGEITDINFRATVDYEKPGLRALTFRDQIWCRKKYTKPGDSGALVIDKATGKAVGLHFAGADGGSAHNPIEEVLKALEVKLVTASLPKGKAKTKTKKSTPS